MTAPTEQAYGNGCALTAAICSHNPSEKSLQETLSSLRMQEPLGEGRSWELLIIDNASARPLSGLVDVSWHPDQRIIREERLGLTHARLRSFHAARGDIIVYIDDDNILAPDYLRLTLEAFDADPKLGAAGGKAIPRYEAEPPEWFAELRLSLACRDLGDVPLQAEWDAADKGCRHYPGCAPIGAGMGVRRSACADYVESVANDPLRSALDRRGRDLSSGGDNDIVMSILEDGWRVAYLPQLSLEHLIPAQRLTRDYLARYARSSNRTWVQVLDVHGIRPWQPIPAWSVRLRKLKAFLVSKAWASIPNYIRWRGMCGLLEGQAAIANR